MRFRIGFTFNTAVCGFAGLCRGFAKSCMQGPSELKCRDQVGAIPGLRKHVFSYFTQSGFAFLLPCRNELKEAFQQRWALTFSWPSEELDRHLKRNYCLRTYYTPKTVAIEYILGTQNSLMEARLNFGP